MLGPIKHESILFHEIVVYSLFVCPIFYWNSMFILLDLVPPVDLGIRDSAMGPQLYRPPLWVSSSHAPSQWMKSLWMWTHERVENQPLLPLKAGWVSFLLCCQAVDSSSTWWKDADENCTVAALHLRRPWYATQTYKRHFVTRGLQFHTIQM